MEYKVKVNGLRQAHSAFKRYNTELKLEFEHELIDAGEIVAREARDRFLAIDARSAEGFRPRLRGFGRVVVEQRLRRKTGQHPEYGMLQMRRALIPAAGSKEREIIGAVEKMLDRLGREWEH